MSLTELKSRQVVVTASIEEILVAGHAIALPNHVPSLYGQVQPHHFYSPMAGKLFAAAIEIEGIGDLPILKRIEAVADHIGRYGIEIKHFVIGPRFCFAGSLQACVAVRIASLRRSVHYAHADMLAHEPWSVEQGWICQERQSIAQAWAALEGDPACPAAIVKARGSAFYSRWNRDSSGVGCAQPTSPCLSLPTTSATM